MADPSGSEKYGIEEILICFITVSQTFACMKEKGTIVWFDISASSNTKEGDQTGLESYEMF